MCDIIEKELENIIIEYFKNIKNDNSFDNMKTKVIEKNNYYESLFDDLDKIPTKDYINMIRYIPYFEIFFRKGWIFNNKKDKNNNFCFCLIKENAQFEFYPCKLMPWVLEYKYIECNEYNKDDVEIFSGTISTSNNIKKSYKIKRLLSLSGIYD